MGWETAGIFSCCEELTEKETHVKIGGEEVSGQRRRLRSQRGSEGGNRSGGKAPKPTAVILLTYDEPVGKWRSGRVNCMVISGGGGGLQV